MAHAHDPSVTGRYLGLSILLTLAFLSWYAVWVGRRPADARRTYGYHRVGVLAALGNGVSLVVMMKSRRQLRD